MTWSTPGTPLPNPGASSTAPLPLTPATSPISITKWASGSTCSNPPPWLSRGMCPPPPIHRSAPRLEPGGLPRQPQPRSARRTVRLRRGHEFLAGLRLPGCRPRQPMEVVRSRRTALLCQRPDRPFRRLGLLGQGYCQLHLGRALRESVTIVCISGGGYCGLPRNLIA